MHASPCRHHPSVGWVWLSRLGIILESQESGSNNAGFGVEGSHKIVRLEAHHDLGKKAHGTWVQTTSPRLPVP